MRVPPPLAVRLAPTPLLRRAVRLLAGATTAFLLVWMADHAGASLVFQQMIAAAALLAGAAAALRTRAATAASLGWNGHRWTVDAATGSVDVAIDLGSWMLLRFRPDGAPPWRRRWLETRAIAPPRQWASLRAALFAAPADDAAAGEVPF